jgi:hypothetical protein
VATPAARGRIARWLRAGRPVADMDGLYFDGDDFVRLVVVRTINSLPQPVANMAVEQVEWIEVGRSNKAQSSAWRTPGPREGRIKICGREHDDYLTFLVSHELGHQWHRAAPVAPLSGPPPTQVETLASLRALAEDMDMPDADEYIERHRREREALADDFAAAMGYPRPSKAP